MSSRSAQRCGDLPVGSPIFASAQTVPFAVNGNTLRINGLSVVEGGKTLNWTRG